VNFQGHIVVNKALVSKVSHEERTLPQHCVA
jgi:hypothetical protein